MTGVFEDIVIEWDGTEYTISSDRVLGAIARIEEIVTIVEINRMAANGGAFKLVQISKAYASILRYAGAEVSDEQVYIGMFENGKSRDRTMSAITGLLAMMIPRSPSPANSGNPKGRTRKTASSSSRRRTKQRSVEGG